MWHCDRNLYILIYITLKNYSTKLVLVLFYRYATEAKADNFSKAKELVSHRIGILGFVHLPFFFHITRQ